MSHDAFWAIVNVAVAFISLIGLVIASWWFDKCRIKNCPCNNPKN